MDVLKQALVHVLEEFRSQGYDFWREQIGKDPLMLAHPSDSNVQIEVTAMWDRVKPGGAVRVMVSTFEMQPKRNVFRVPTSSFLIFEDGRVDAFGRD